MKKLLIILGILIVVLMGAVSYLGVISYDFYDDATHINSLEEISDETYAVYYYSDNCSYCHEIKSSINDFTESSELEEFNAYVVDMGVSANASNYPTGDEIVYTDVNQLPEGFDPIDYRISGTPNIVYVLDGEINMIGSGSTGTVEVIEAIREEFNF